MEPARTSLLARLERWRGRLDDYAFPRRIDHSDHLSTRQYARLVEELVTGIGLRKEDYGAHSLQRTKASITYNRRATYEQCRDPARSRKDREDRSLSGS